MGPNFASPFDSSPPVNAPKKMGFYERGTWRITFKLLDSPSVGIPPAAPSGPISGLSIIALSELRSIR